MSVAAKVYELEKEFKKLKKIHDRTVKFLRSIGPKDPRSGGFIAKCVLRDLGEPSNYLLSQIRGKDA